MFSLLLPLISATAQRVEPQQLLQQADEAERFGDQELAARRYREVIQLDPDLIAARASLGEVLVSLGRFDEAVAEYRAALARVPGDPMLELDLARAWYGQAEFWNAANELQILDQQQPGNREALHLLADCLLRLGRNGDAAKLLKPAFKAHPDDRTIDYALATALIRDGRLREGKLVVDRILQNGNAAQARLLTGAAQLAAGESAKAITTIHQALAQNARLPGGWTSYGQALMESGDYENAKKAFARAIQADTNDFEANLDFGRLLRFGGDNLAAEPYLERSLRLRPDSLSARFQVGALNLALGRLDEAERELERVARESPDSQEVHEQLAALYDRLNRQQDGERERQIFLRLGQGAGPHTFQTRP